MKYLLPVVRVTPNTYKNRHTPVNKNKAIITLVRISGKDTPFDFFIIEPLTIPISQFRCHKRLLAEQLLENCKVRSLMNV